MEKERKLDIDSELCMAILAALAVHYPDPLPDPDATLMNLADGDRELMMFHVWYLGAHKMIKTNLVELFRAPSKKSEDVLNPARLSWAPGPALTKKGLNVHLGVEPVSW